MFRKAQLRLFAIITGILILVFAAVLIAVNVITKTVSQRQSMKVLKEIAQGVEYDDNTSTFTFIRDDKHRDHHEDEPPEKPPGEPGNDEPYPKDDPTHENNEATKDEKKTESTTKEKVTDGTTGQNKTQPSQQPDTQSNTASPETSQQVTPQTESPKTQAQTRDDTTEAPKTDSPTPQATEAPKTQAQPQTTAPSQHQTIVTTTVPNGPPEPPPRPWGEDDWHNRDHNDNPFGPHYWNDFYYDSYSNEPYEECEQPYYNNYRGSGTDGEEVPSETTSAYDEQEYDTEDDDDSVGTELSNGLYTGEIVQLGNNTSSTTKEKTTESPTSMFDDMRPKGEEVPKSLGSIDFFIVMADENGQYLAQLNNEDLEQSVAQNYINAILKENATSGMVNNYQFYRLGKDNGTLMVFTDKTGELAMLKQLFRTTVIIGIISLIVLSAVAYFISLRIMQPLKTAFNKQKQFISDASHELKTPLTVISANADVLSGEIGENKWLTYIKSQTDRMNLLVNELLNLTRLENNTSQFERADFDLSKAINNTALPFECKAFESNKKLELNVEEGMTVNGSERHIKQMAAIFIDNAIKYSNDGGTIIVTLKKVGDKKMFSVYNTGSGIKEEEKEKIFERFYRSDDSRTHLTDGGYGLGLPIAKSIIDKHKFKLTVDNHEGQSICFIVTMP